MIEPPPKVVQSNSANQQGWFGRHWLAFFNAIVFVYVLLPIVAPVLLDAGWNRAADAIYTIYSPTCHQMAFRSIFLDGEQFVYPRAHAETLNDDLHSFESYAEHLHEFEGVPLEGLEAELMIAARRFRGNVEMGFKTAICQRDLAIFGFLFLGGVIYGTVGRRYGIGPLPLWAFVLIGMGPIGLDGFSQLFSYPIESIPIRESPPFLRIGTGALFGFCVAWIALPHIERSFKRT